MYDCQTRPSTITSGTLRPTKGNSLPGGAEIPPRLPFVATPLLDFRLLIALLLSVFLQTLAVHAQFWIVPIREVPDPLLQDISAAQYDAEGPVIRFNPNLAGRAGPNITAFFRAHEYAHLYMRHIERTMTLPDPISQAALRRALEKEADCVAARRLAESSPAAVSEAIRFFKTQGSSRADAAHPTGEERANNILECIGENQAIPAGEERQSGEAKLETFQTRDSNPEAVKDLSLTSVGDSDRIKWNTAGNPPIVRLNLTYKNSGDRAIRCEILLACGTMPMSAPKNDYSDWLPYDVRKLAFTLKAGEERTLDQVLSWQVSRPKGTMPAVRFPNPPRLTHDAEFLKCNYIVQASTEADFCTQLARLLSSTEHSFQGIKSEATRRADKDGYTTWEATLLLPGAKTAEIELSKGVCSYTSELFSSTKHEAVRARFEKLAQDIKACLPAGWKPVKGDGKGEYRFKKENVDGGGKKAVSAMFINLDDQEGEQDAKGRSSPSSVTILLYDRL